ncbi:MAG: hypothetical protein AAGJ18_11135 [Bacteroidota bacterium]
MKNILFLSILLLFACQFESKEKPFDPRAIDASKEIFNWTIKTGEQVGLIKKSFTEADIIKAYGQENVSRKEIGLGEGETAKATVLFPNTENELFIIWEIGKEYQTINEILIEHPDAPWMTSQGIGIGTTLEKLVETNGKDFQFAGFEWDYSGYTNDWQDGKISKNLVVFLDPSDPEKVYPDLLGDELFSSSLPKAKDAGLKVRTMMIRFE